MDLNAYVLLKENRENLQDQREYLAGRLRLLISFIGNSNNYSLVKEIARTLL
jgi:hypothetical protein